MKRKLKRMANVVGWGTNFFFHPRTPLGKLVEVGCFLVPFTASYFAKLQFSFTVGFLALLLGLAYIIIGLGYNLLNSRGGLAWPTTGNKIKTCIFGFLSGAIFGLSIQVFGFEIPFILLCVSLVLSIFANYFGPTKEEMQQNNDYWEDYRED